MSESAVCNGPGTDGFSSYYDILKKLLLIDQQIINYSQICNWCLCCRDGVVKLWRSDLNDGVSYSCAVQMQVSSKSLLGGGGSSSPLG